MNNQDFKNYIFLHPLFPKLVVKYPNRDLEYQFELMTDWWLNNRKKLPKSISAFDNWLKNTKEDPSLIVERQKQSRLEAMKEQQEKLGIISGPTEATLQKLKEIKERFNK